MAAEKQQSWFKASIAKLWPRDDIQAVQQAGFDYSETLTTQALIGAGVISARSRQLLYAKYQQMQFDPIVSGAMRLHVTAALGGHETSGDLVFIEPSAEARGAGNASDEALAKELAQDLGPIFNRIAMQVAYNGVVWGDAFGRLYAKQGVGVVDVTVDETMLPPLVQPYTRGNETVVCVVAIGAKMRERLTMNQIAHLKMPRMLYSPQPLAIEKAWRSKVLEDDVEALPVMPEVVGGSFLADAENQYDKFVAAMGGLVGQRVLDSIDESIFTAQVQGMTAEQSQQFRASLVQVLKRSKEVADQAVKTGVPFMGRIRHILPVWGEKQIMQVQGVNSSGGSGGGRAGNISIEDVLFHAKLLSGALGIDLTMLGFADMMSGGLGEGGFFRTSAQSAERSRTVRVALSDFFNHIADVHLAYKKGIAFKRNQRPWRINFYGSISALETERQRTESDAMNAGSLLVGTLTQLKELGLDEKAMADMLENTLKMDTERAKLYAKAIADARAEAQKQAEKDAGGGGGFGGGGFGGGGGGGGDAGAGGGGEDDDPAATGSTQVDPSVAVKKGAKKNG